ncbi:TIGR03564 family F420-dependent LLM class oxidoreductase [Mycolicibacterium aichiense]|uniref:LLM class F420-dependent oxidoreductase n=1 Tax=Mycolicibacterium aichiense TaxID=1799 RepID=A0AAD1MEQ0_9MYCO|nr:TIGR03564 family F420-dependent LLM class oxidoreductase [Mycolicibacterium aichiense]MCV7017396.1 TIGR03564 family F420-dependent LLM class oxidoreductase [Mycolicibacterium aichiense]BBX10171.1 LLM class F420-dependent oxidoreductase [Mycolicibacterium aichiense]STZ26163.1 monooxygenase [Mycolicibacterium aichiense]
MTTGVLLTPDRCTHHVVDDTVAQARLAREAGVRQVWLGQQLDLDAIALAGIVGALVPELGVGTSVVPINPRHPLVVAAAAQTAQSAARGRFSLGLGLGVAMLEQIAFGVPTDHVGQRLREYLTVLCAIRDMGTVNFQGAYLTAVDPHVMPVALPSAVPYPIYVAAMGPQALRVTGELADGTLPYAGPRTLDEVIVPAITAAAADAGRPTPQVFGLVNVAITDDVDSARAVAAETLAMYDQVPSYQRINSREGVSSVADLALIGSAQDVAKGLARYLDAGATDVVLMPVLKGRDALARVCEVAADLPAPRARVRTSRRAPA